jgi:hypothetical protein
MERLADGQHRPSPSTSLGGIMTSCPLAAEDVASPEALPTIGKWMLDPSLSPAHWIGEILDGKALQEPINVLILDPLTGSSEEAKDRLTQSCAAAGYPSREGHSSGYLGCIGGQLFGQLPEGKDDAFSDAPFVVDNNHGRIFGPCEQNGQQFFTGAFSREKVVPLAKVRHQYVSFNRARDDFAQKLTRNGAYQVRGYVNLDNFIISDAITTGDHDGIAVLIVAVG